MNLKELEKYLNDYIKENNLEDEKMYYSSCQSKIITILNEKIGDLLGDKFYITEYMNREKGNVYIKGYGNNYAYITFKIHRKKHKEQYFSGWNYYSQYGIKSVELYFENDILKWETLEEFKQFILDKEQEKINDDNKRVDDFLQELTDKNLTIDDFKKLRDMFNSIDYWNRQKLLEQNN